MAFDDRTVGLKEGGWAGCYDGTNVTGSGWRLGQSPCAAPASHMSLWVAISPCSVGAAVATGVGWSTTGERQLSKPHAWAIRSLEVPFDRGVATRH